jgi:hypothetical protein
VLRVLYCDNLNSGYVVLYSTTISGSDVFVYSRECVGLYSTIMDSSDVLVYCQSFQKVRSVVFAFMDSSDVLLYCQSFQRVRSVVFDDYGQF